MPSSVIRSEPSTANPLRSSATPAASSLATRARSSSSAPGIRLPPRSDVVRLAQQELVFQLLASDLHDEPADRRVRPGRLIAEHVVADEAHDPLALRHGPAPVVEELVRQLRADRLVAQEPAVRHRQRLADVMEQRREADPRGVGGRPVDRAERVIPEVLAGDLVLRHAGLRGEIRGDGEEQPGLGHQPKSDRRTLGGEQAPHLDRDPLAGQAAHVVGLLADGGQRRGLDLEVERRRQPDGADHAEGVFMEALGGVADGPQGAGREVGLAAVRIDESRRLPGLGAPGHRVDREIAAG